MTQVVRISKQGKNVLGTAATDPNNLIFDSQYNTFKILNTGTVAGSISASSTGTLSVSHSLGFAPPVDGYIRAESGTRVVGSSGSVPFPLGSFTLKSVSADGTNVYFEIENSYFSDQGFVCRYYTYEIPQT